MSFSNIHLNIEEGVAFVIIDHPPANALNTDTLTELSKGIDEMAHRQEVKVIVITGKGRFFIAGADIKEFTQAFGSAEMAKQMSERGQALCNQIEQLNKPVIAAINGDCLGGGLELAMSCHLRLAADEAKLGLPELKLGLIPAFGGTQRLARLTNKAKALELILTSRFINGKESERIGLINASLPSDRLMSEVKNLALVIAREKSSISVTKAVEAISKGLEETLTEGLSREARFFGEIFGTEDCKEGVNAFLEKRQPKFNHQ